MTGQRNRVLRCGIAGLGTVGLETLKFLKGDAAKLQQLTGTEVELTAVCARDKSKDRGVDISDLDWFDSADDLAKSKDIDVFVELIGGEEGIARSSVEAALSHGKHVITANKALLAHHGHSLAQLAEDNSCVLYYEAAVAGGIPIIKTLREAVPANKISRIHGILNGTCNFILSEMLEKSREFSDVLQEAQTLGYAEADPTFDIGGFDAAHKLALLASLSFGVQVDFESVHVEGIEEITLSDLKTADELGYSIKLLGVAKKTDHGIEQRVHPTLVPYASPISGVRGVYNAVALEGDKLGELMLVGQGAGAGPTASAVISDIADIARGTYLPSFAIPTSDLKDQSRAQMKAHEGSYYIALRAFDHPGAVAAIANRMAENGISIESIIQKPADNNSPEMLDDNKPVLPVMMITHRTTELAVRESLNSIEKDGHIAHKPRMIRIERFGA